MRGSFSDQGWSFSALMHSKLWWCNLTLNENWIIKDTPETCRRHRCSLTRNFRSRRNYFNDWKLCSSMRLCSFRRIFQMPLCNDFRFFLLFLQSKAAQRRGNKGKAFFRWWNSWGIFLLAPVFLVLIKAKIKSWQQWAKLIAKEDNWMLSGRKNFIFAERLESSTVMFTRKKISSSFFPRKTSSESSDEEIKLLHLVQPSTQQWSDW